jgi:NhaP-type Na+/H+ or K+/H+ antiporter
LGSVILAVFCGFASALFFRFIDMRKYPTLEITLFLFFAYGPYLISLPYLSGIMVILILGIVMSYYTAPNMSKLAQDTISNASKSIAFISETFVFIYLGFACFSFKNQHWDILLIVFVLVSKCTIQDYWIFAHAFILHIDILPYWKILKYCSSISNC